MFDIGFMEMLVCAVVALVVIGPEKLPKVARTVGILAGRLQRYVAQVKSDINREMEAAELGKVKTEFENAARTFQSGVQSQATDLERDIRDAQSAIERSLDVNAQAANEPAPPAELQEPPAAQPSPQLELGIEEPQAAPRDRAQG